MVKCKNMDIMDIKEWYYNKVKIADSIYKQYLSIGGEFDHLANVNKERKINLVNQKEGYLYPFRMVTPLEVISNED